MSRLRLIIVLTLSIIATVLFNPKSPTPDGDGLFLVSIESGNSAVVRGWRDSSSGEWRATHLSALYGGDSTLRLQSGDEVVARGRIAKFGRRSYIYLHPKNIIDITESRPSLKSRLRVFATRRLEGLSLDAESEGVVKAMVVGDRSSIDNLEQYRRTGAAHILAVSGLHVGIVAALLMVLLAPLSLLFRGYWWRRLGAIGGVWLFAAINNFSPSVERAAIMISIMLAAPLLERRYSTLSTLLLAVGVMLLLDPMLIHDVGFQLSVVSVVAICVWVIPIFRALPSPLRGRVSTLLLLPMLMGLCCSIATLPIIVYNFGYISLLGVVLNPLLLLTSQIIISLSVIWLLLGWIAPLAPIFRVLIEFSTDVQNRAVESIYPYTTSSEELYLGVGGVVLIYFIYILVTLSLSSLIKDCQ